MSKDIVTCARQAARLRVLETAIYRGPHLFSRTPMVRIQIDLGALEDYPTNLLPGFTDALVAALPGLGDHGCSRGVPGGLIERMKEGTWIGHVTEHVALELQTLAGAHVTRGKTRSVKGQPGVYNMMYAYQDPQVALMAGRFALELVESLLPDELKGLEGLEHLPASPLPSFDLFEAIRYLHEMHVDLAFGPTTASIIEEAEARGIPWRRLDSSSLVQLGWGRNIKRICASCSSLTSQIATEIASDKELTNQLLDAAGLPVPRSALATTAEDAVAAARRLGYPVVTKPLDGNHGRGVNVGLADEDEVRFGFEQAREHSRQVLVEQHFEGADHRILVIGGKLVAVAKRVPAHVIGDGVSSLQALIERENLNPKRGEGHEAPMTRITVDECLLRYIARSGLTLDTVPALGEIVMLRPTANISTGGSAIDLTEVIHPDNALIATRAAEIVGLDIAGIDFVAPDITRSVVETGGGIIEVNAGPGFRMHLYPSEGKPRNVAKPVLDLLYPKSSPSRIPVFAITGTNGKTTTTRMLAHILASTGQRVGLTTSTGVYIDGRRVQDGDCTGPRSARIILGDPSVDVAVLETARGGLLREGLAFDRCDIGCVTNVSGDHLGLKGIETVEDLAEVKSVIVEAVKPDGWSVLNADNIHTANMVEIAGGRICFFTMQARTRWPQFLAEHVRAGGRLVAFEETGEIVLHDRGGSYFVTRADEIPATLGGMAEFNVENALAAASMAICHGLPLPTIREALASFGTSYEQSPGRLNVTDRHGFRVIFDYAHNPDGMRALGALVTKLKPRHRRLIGVLGMPGDRRDADLFEMGRLAASVFDMVIVKEDEDRRGRHAGEVSQILAEGLKSGGFPASSISVILEEKEAVEAALDMAEKGDLVVLTVDDLEAMWELVSRYRRPDFHPHRSLAPRFVGQGAAH
jgi:cyanophycin synthetase